MYAIISDGSHQYRVEEGMVLDVELKPELEEGAKSLTFDRVLFVGDTEGGPKIGLPVVKGAQVTASIVEQFKGEKVIIRKFRRRKKYALKKGHRQKYLRLRVETIQA